VIALDAGRVVGVMFQSPLTFIATVTTMPTEAVEAIVDDVAATAPALPGVSGEAATAARFAGHWTERTRSAAVPEQGQRIYEIASVARPTLVPGALRRAVADDEALLVEWLHGFGSDTAESVDDAVATVRRRVAAGQVWLWDDGEARSMAALTDPVAGVSRVQTVYTPPDLRGRGYASANVAAISGLVLSKGDRCILYTELSNPVSNSVYRRLGYRAVTEVVRYRFE
jgi:predicted GNAT family acetyltransferase